MADWYATTDLLGLPGLPTSKAGLIKRAEKQSWQRRQRAGRGGGFEYHISSLPPAARKHMATSRSGSQVAQAAGAHAGRKVAFAEKSGQHLQQRAQHEGLARSVHLTGEARTRMDAKLAILNALGAYLKVAGLTGKTGLIAFVAAYNAKEISMPDGVRERHLSITDSTIYRWRGAVDQFGVAALGGRYGNRTGTSRIDTDPDLPAFIAAMITDHPHVSCKLIMRGIRARFDKPRHPSYRGLQRWVRAWKGVNAQLLTRITNPDQWRSQYMAADGSASAGVVNLNQVWEADSTPADLLLADGKRHAIIGVIDIYTRRLKLHVSRTSKATAITALLRRCLMDWGVPETLKTDNGADYISHHVVRVCEGLGIEQSICPPFTPEAKPHIERAFGTFCRDLVDLAPGYIGHSVADRKDIEARRSFADRLMSRGQEGATLGMTPEELQAFCDQWTDQIYAHDPHGGLAQNTPFQMAAEWTGEVQRVADERALDVLLAEAPGEGWRQVGKKGIRVAGGTFTHANLAGHEGRQVRVLFDEADAGHIYVFSEDGEFIAKAFCPELTGVSRKEVAHARKAKQKKIMSAGVKELKQQARKVGTQNIVTEILTSRAVADNMVTLPRPTTTHSTPALEAAAEAARAGDGPAPTPETDEQAAQRRRFEARFKAAQKKPEKEETAEDRYRRWRDIDQQIADGQTVGEGEAMFHRTYPMSIEYISQKEFVQAFNLI